MKNKIVNKNGKTFIGKVVGDKMANTIVVFMDYTQRHPIYKKIITKHKKVYVDNNLSAKVDDIVKIRESRPLSKQKRFVTVEIIKKIK